MSVIENLKVVLTADNFDLRKKFAASGKSLTDFNKQVEATATQIKRLAKGTGGQYWATGVRGSLNAGGAVQVHDQALSKLVATSEHYINTLRAMRLGVYEYSSASKALAVQTERAAVSQNMLSSSSALMVSRLFNTSSAVSNTTFALADLDLVNYSLTNHMKNANWVQILTQGSGRAVHAVEAVKKSLFGIIPASHAIQKVMKDLVVPGLLAASTALLKMKDSNPFAGQLAHGLTTFARDFENFGAKSRTTFRLFLDQLGRLPSAPFRWVATTAGEAAKQMYAMSIQAGILRGSALSLGASLLAVSAAAAQVVLVFGYLVKHTILLATAITGYLLKATWNVAGGFASMAAAALRAVSMSSLTAVMTAAAISAARLGEVLARSTIRGLMAIPSAARRATASLLGLNKVTQGLQFGFMEIAGVAGLLGAAGAAVYGLFKGVSGGFDWANQAEQVRVNLKVMTGSFEEADKILKGVKDWGKDTPFLIPGLNDAARELLTFGVAAKQIVPTMKVLGDLSGGNEDRFKELVGVYSRLKAQGGTVQLDDLNMIAARGVPIFDELAKTMGKSQAELRAMITAGQVGLPDIQKAFVALTSKGGKFFDGLKESTDTVIGQTGRFKEAMGLVFQDIADGWNKAFGTKQSLASWSNILLYVRGTIVPGIVGAFNWVGTSINNVVDWAMKAWQKFGPYLAQVWKKGSEAVVSVFVWLGNRMKDIFNWFNTALFGNQKGIVDWEQRIKDALFSVQFFFANWQDYVNIALLQGTLGLVMFANKTEHFLIKVIPAALKWFANNWAAVFVNVATFTMHLLNDLGQNIATFWKAVAEQVATGGTADWKPQYKKMLGDWKQIKVDPFVAPERVKGPLEKQLEGEVDALKKELAARKAAAAGQVPPPIPGAGKLPAPPGVPGLKIDDPNAPLPGKGRRGGGGRTGSENRAIERGTVEAASAKVRSQNERVIRGIDRVDRNGKLTNEQIKRLNDNLKKAGLPPLKIGGGG